MGQVELIEIKKVAKTTLISIVVIVAVLSAGYAFLRSIGIIEPNACISEQRMTIPELSGARVELVQTNCDTLAKDEAISIYFSRSAVKGDSWFARWRNHRALVFRYDPGRSDNPLPSITNSAHSTILISVPEVSSAIYQSGSWENISIAYKIGKCTTLQIPSSRLCQHLWYIYDDSDVYASIILLRRSCHQLTFAFLLSPSFQSVED